MAAPPTPYTSVFELARAAPSLGSAAFHRLYELSLGHPRCKASPALHAKYGVAQDNRQAVLRVANRATLQQCWFNEERTRKPQTFAAAGAADAAAFDPLARRGGACDFCDWRELTAEDSWGRVEGPHAVSASNLFKYVKPAQGVVLLKEGHDPLRFGLEQVQDLVRVSHAWFLRAADAEADAHRALGLPPRPLHPLLVWNCLPRAGASQYHSHAQVLLSDAPFPALQAEAEAAATYDYSHPGKGYWQDLLAAHHDVGLLVREGREGDYSFAYAALAPWKDMEVCIHGSSMESASFQRLLYAALRALVDGLGAHTFNAAIHNIRLPREEGAPPPGYLADLAGEAPVVARVVSRGRLTSLASDFGGLEVFGGASIGHTDPFRVAEALREAHAALPPP